MTNNSGLKICDFRHATYAKNYDDYYNKGTLGFQPPEIFHKKKYTSKADIFCTGVILYQLLSGKLIYEDHNPGRAIK